MRELLSKTELASVTMTPLFSALTTSIYGAEADDDFKHQAGGDRIAPIHGRQLEIAGTVKGGGMKHVKARILTDTGASAIGFVSKSFTKINKLQRMKLTRACVLKVADGKPSQIITHAARVPLTLGEGHEDSQWFLIAEIGTFDAILGMPWLEIHQPVIDFEDRSLTFKSLYCRGHCLKESKPVRIFSHGGSHKEPRYRSPGIWEISAEAFALEAADPKNEIITIWPEDFDSIKPNENGGQMASNVCAIAAEDYDKFHEKLHAPPMPEEELRATLPAAYHKLLDLFNVQKGMSLPPHRDGVDHKIQLEPGAKAPKRRVYGLNHQQMGVVKAYIDDMMAKGLIRRSTSEWVSPLCIAKKPGGGLRICVDYRGLNAITSKNRNAPPTIRDTLTRLAKAKIFTKFDVVTAFHEIRMAEGHEKYTAWGSRYGNYEYLIMPFGLCNAPGTFQAFINETLSPFLDDFCTAYLDDILVYSENEDEHEGHCLKVMNALKKAGLYLDIRKSEFSVKRTKYLGLIISTDGIAMDQEKVRTIQEWGLPRSIKDVQAFLGFCNFYRRFIKGYSAIAAPLFNITKGEHKNFLFPWALDSPQHKAFQALKAQFREGEVMAHFDPDLETWVETDASDFVTAAVLSQMKDGVLRPVAFMSNRMTPAQCNYSIYDKELMAIVKAFEEWKPELSGTKTPVRVKTDHQNLEWFTTSQKLNRRQARWAEFFSEFNFKITYRPGAQGTKPDSLTRRPGDIPEGADDPRVKHQVQTVLPPDRFEEVRATEAFGAHTIQSAGELAGDAFMTSQEACACLYAIAEIEAGDIPDEEAEQQERETEGTATPDLQEILKDVRQQIGRAHV